MYLLGGVVGVISSIFSFLFLVLKNLPAIMDFIKLIAGKIEEAQDAIEKKKKAEEIRKAIQDAKNNKDTSGLEDLFGTKLVKAQPVTVNLVIEEKKKTLAPLIEEELLQKPLSRPLMEPTRMATPQELASISSGLKILSTEPTKEEPKKEPTVLSVKASGGPARAFFRSFGVMGGNASNVIVGSNKQRTEMRGVTRMGSRFFTIILLVFTAIGCKKADPINLPTFKPRLYAGSSSDAAIVRKQSNEVISCESPEINEYVAMKYTDLSCIYETYVFNCERYKTATPKCSDLSPEKIKSLLDKRKILKKIN